MVPQRQRRRPAQERNRTLAKRGFAGVAAVVGLLVGVTSLVDWVSGKLDSPDPPPPQEIDARISSVELRTVREPYGDYLQMINESFPGLTEAELKEQGLVFAARVRLEGGQGKRFMLRLSLFDAKTQQRLRDPAYTLIAADFEPASQNHATSWPSWFPYPWQGGTYFLRATLLNAEKQPVDERDSQPFKITRIPPIPR
jgi:hypothetical protein